jgi:uncharacterized protein YbjT (DUF2867 family)
MPLVTVVGASGRQGLAQVRQSLAAGLEVRAISRQEDPFKSTDIDDSVEVRSADLYAPETLVPAFEGSDYVFYNHPLQARADRATLVADIGLAAKEVGAKRVVWNTSSWIPDCPGDAHTYAGNTAGINALWRTGMPATVFGSVLFMDNLLTNWARPFIVNEGRYVYPHRPDLEANWISLDDVAKIMIASLDRPDFEGSWMNIGGPERIKPPQVAEALTDALEKPVKYDPCTPEEFGDLLVAALGDSLEPELRKDFSAGIAAFYHYNNDAETKPFEVDTEYMRHRLPELEYETISDWTKRQYWGESNHRPSGG